jgi:hypothetical protein
VGEKIDSEDGRAVAAVAATMRTHRRLRERCNNGNVSWGAPEARQAGALLLESPLLAFFLHSRRSEDLANIWSFATYACVTLFFVHPATSKSCNRAPF